jgi:hypothetical protein
MAHARCVGLIETCEESGSYDLPAYLDALASRMGHVDFVVGLDSGCGDYERLWATTSLRGIAAGTLSVTVLTEGVHSGDASGIVPSSFASPAGFWTARGSTTGRVFARFPGFPTLRRRARPRDHRRHLGRQSIRLPAQPMVADRKRC